MILYKYLVPERIDILKGGKIRFSQYQALNDPYEVKPSIGTYRSEGITQVENLLKVAVDASSFDFVSLRKMVQTIVDSALEELLTGFHKLLILSLTQNRNNLLMWSHYTNSHQGFVIGFDSEDSFFNQRSGMHQMTKLYNIKYSKSRSRLPKFQMPDMRYYSDPNFKGPPLTQFTLENFISILTRKSEHWSYEEELRIFVEADPFKVVAKVAGLDLYLYEFPKESVKEIVFGSLMSETDRQEIAEIVKKDYPNCKLFAAHLRDDIFDLQIKPYKV